jgi:hypothetical protein
MDQGGSIGSAIIKGSGAGATTIGIGATIIGSTSGDSDSRMVIGGMSPWKDVSQLDDNVFPPSNC